MPIFKSGLEKKAWKILKKHIPRVKYEPDAIPYRQPAKERKYTPDFKVAQGVYIEAKGKLDLATRQKMVWFKDMHPRITIIFLFMNPDNKIVYTIQYRNHDFKSFIKHIYAGLHKITKDDDINPSEKTINALNDKELQKIIKGTEVTFDTDVNIKFNRYRELFTINHENKELDLDALTLYVLLILHHPVYYG